jgi:hypothetical protein
MILFISSDGFHMPLLYAEVEEEVGSDEASEVSVEDSHTAERSEAESEDGRDSAGDYSINSSSSSSEGEWNDTATAKASSKKRKADGMSEKEDGQSEPEEEDSNNDSLFDASELDAISKGKLSKMMPSKEEEEDGNATHTALIKADQIRWKAVASHKAWNAPRRSYRRGLEEGRAVFSRHGGQTERVVGGLRRGGGRGGGRCACPHQCGC